MIFRPLLGADLSGSLGGITAGHNAGGPFFRVRAVPTNPRTTFQETIRAATADLTVRWNDDLTQLQRDAWDVYATNVPLPNANGEARSIPGLAMYVRSNVSRIQAADPRVDNAPTTFNLGAFTAPTIASITAATDLLSLNFTEADAWVGEDDSSMLIYTSRPQNPSIKFFINPYRFAARIEGDSGAPPTSPASIALAFPAAVGNQIFIRVRVTRADGRLSADFRDVDVVV